MTKGHLVFCVYSHLAQMPATQMSVSKDTYAVGQFSYAFASERHMCIFSHKNNKTMQSAWKMGHVNWKTQNRVTIQLETKNNVIK